MAVEYDLIPLSDFDDIDSARYKSKHWARRRRCSPALHLFRRTPRLFRPVYLIIAFFAFLNWQIIFNASYQSPPPFTIPREGNVYIAANIINADLITGAWGDSLNDLVDLIGKDRVYVSIYGGPSAALKTLESKLDCDNSLVSEEDDPIDLDTLPHITLSNGKQKTKRITFLAEVRNRALEPLNTLDKKFDKVLFINDVFFSAAGAARILWGTNVNAQGVSEYKAACAMDFINSWKYYDTFATRDFEGYSMGLPIYPWFSSEGNAVSRRDVLAGLDAVRVKSCWGGMVAFDARYLQRDLSSTTKTRATREKPKNLSSRKVEPPKLPIRFRSEPEPFWDSSECCLIHADIMAATPFQAPSKELSKTYGDGIFMNPYVRVTYDASTYNYLWLAQRFERLFRGPQSIINSIAKLPRYNYRRAEAEGDIVDDREWVPNTTSRTRSDVGESSWQSSEMASSRVKRGSTEAAKGKEYWDKKGHYVDVKREATRGAYCGVRSLLVLKESKGEGEGNWDTMLDEVPPLEN
ncbi:hypothetical protein VE01_04927 [Pseudogymnoascus verrucosus]|uniref:Glycosyltransferase family 69 protein n=1 Tax=Pseudogymnoascus verrucosus TaxID=342668 RepID=A0A1B8GMM9_9PEZI|nr:uncharacterized protein VE01_04927 [Pseudogymnoascus verrucosus]OBT97090.1 hypothetical protein VE01_04927 [Pseudogymnoascus verrucosus]